MPSAQELARAAAWLAQRRNRILKRAELDSAFPGDEAAAAEVRAGFDPLVRAAVDSRLPPEEDYPDSRIVKNHNIF